MLTPLCWLAYPYVAYHPLMLTTTPLCWLPSPYFNYHPLMLTTIPLCWLPPHYVDYHPLMLINIPLFWKPWFYVPCELVLMKQIIRDFQLFRQQNHVWCGLIAKECHALFPFYIKPQTLTFKQPQTLTSKHASIKPANNRNFLYIHFKFPKLNDVHFVSVAVYRAQLVKGTLQIRPLTLPLVSTHLSI